MSEVNKYISQHKQSQHWDTLTELNMKTMHCIDRVSPVTGNTNSMFMLLDVADLIKWRDGRGLIQAGGN